MNAQDVANRFRENRYTQADIQSVMKALENNDSDFLADVIASYIKYADNIDERALVRYLMVARDGPAHEIISGLSILRYKDKDFSAELLRYAQGVPWDNEEYARIAAIAALPRILDGYSRVRGVLCTALKSSSVVVRNVALEAAQEFLGVPFSQIKRGWDDEDSMHKVPQEVQEWLGYGPSGDQHH